MYVCMPLNGYVNCNWSTTGFGWLVGWMVGLLLRYCVATRYVLLLYYYCCCLVLNVFTFILFCCRRGCPLACPTGWLTAFVVWWCRGISLNFCCFFLFVSYRFLFILPSSYRCCCFHSFHVFNLDTLTRRNQNKAHDDDDDDDVERRKNVSTSTFIIILMAMERR